MDNKIIYKIIISIKLSITFYTCIYFFSNPIIPDNFVDIDSKFKYYFPKLWKIKNEMEIGYFEKYINDCKLLKNYNRKKPKNKIEFPFLSVCICSHNSMEYIEKAILSILNQSFQNFEIIIIDDYSTDDSYNIFNKYQYLGQRFRIIKHQENFGIYRSRVDAIIYSKGEYILFVDSDDMLLNEYLFEILYSYTFIYHFDIIEYLVLYQAEGKNNLVRPSKDYQVLTHIHNYSKNIISQPELSNIIFYIPQTNNYSSVICRTLWNKMYKKEIFLNSIKYIGKKFYTNSYLNYGEDTIMNILNFHFAKNYTNINIYGYMYNVRNNSISRFTKNIKKRYVLNLGIYYYLKLFYKYIKEFNINRQVLYLEFVLFNKQIFFLKLNDPHFFKKKMKKIFDSIIEDDNASFFFKKYIKNLSKY